MQWEQSPAAERGGVGLRSYQTKLGTRKNAYDFNETQGQARCSGGYLWGGICALAAQAMCCHGCCASKVVWPHMTFAAEAPIEKAARVIPMWAGETSERHTASQSDLAPWPCRRSHWVSVKTTAPHGKGCPSAIWLEL